MLAPHATGDAASDAVEKLTMSTQKVLSLDFKNSDTNTRRKALDQRVFDLQRDISALKSYQNSLTPACRLPQEILANIFLGVASLVRAGVATTTHRTWARTTQVCRYWRAVALDCRELWSTITFQKYEFTDLCLHRSRDFPLTVVIRTLPSEDYQKRGQWGIKIKSILSKAEHLSHLDVKGDHSSTWNSQSRTDLKTIFSYLEGTPKKLQRLTLDCTNCHWENVLPKEFLKDGAPALKNISFTRTEFEWNVPRLHSLTHLHVAEKERAHAKRPDLDSFLAGLRQMPHLQVLELIDALPRHILNLPKSISEAPLVEFSPTLRVVKLIAAAKEIEQFFELTQVPKLAWINIKLADACQVQASQVDECLGALSKSWKDKAEGPASADLNSLSIVDIHKTSKCPRFELLFAQPPVGALRESHSTAHGSKLTIEFADSAVPVHDVFKSIDKHWGLQTVQYFTVENTWSLPSTTYAEMLKAMPSLMVITLRKTWMKYFLDAMVADPALQGSQGVSGGTDKPKPYCPGLVVLHFHLTDFNEHDETKPPALKQIFSLFEKRAKEYYLRQLFISIATNFDHPDGRAVMECFQKIAMPGMEYRWDGSVHMRKPAPPVTEETEEEEDESESESDEGEESEEEEEEAEYECTASDLECF